MTTYTVSTDLKAKPKQGRYVVTAEHEDGYEILYRTHDLGRCQPQASRSSTARKQGQNARRTETMIVETDHMIEPSQGRQAAGHDARHCTAIFAPVCTQIECSTQR